jgi:hypothetical protein
MGPKRVPDPNVSHQWKVSAPSQPIGHSNVTRRERHG